MYLATMHPEPHHDLAVLAFQTYHALRDRSMCMPWTWFVRAIHIPWTRRERCVSLPRGNMYVP